MNDHRVFILGNGFSCTCGLPIASELFKKLTIYEEIPDCFYGDDYNYYCVLEILHTYFEHTKKMPSLEDFFNFIYSFVAVTQKSSIGNLFYPEISNLDFYAAQEFIIKWIEAYLWNFCEFAEDKKHYKYILKFAKLLNDNDIIITFNYDILLEKALHDLGKSFSYNRSNNNNLIILKPHGSINWFQTTREIKKESSNYAPLNKEKTIYKYKHFYTQVGEPLKFQPFIVPPTMLKLYESPFLIRIWEEATISIKNADKLIFIGYSLPKEDQFSRILFHNATLDKWDRKVYIINPSQEINDIYKNFVKGNLIFKKKKFHEALLKDRYIFS